MQPLSFGEYRDEPRKALFPNKAPKWSPPDQDQLNNHFYSFGSLCKIWHEARAGETFASELMERTGLGTASN